MVLSVYVFWFSDDRFTEGVELKVGVALPCHVRDIEICLKYPLPTLELLDPSPHKILVDFNRGVYGGLKQIRTKLFDNLFIVYGCDIVLSVSADYRIINKNIINEMASDKVMTYGRFFNTPIMGLTHYLIKRLTRSSWSSMYSIPKEIWFSEVRNNPLWKGYDGSIPRCVKMNFENHTGINYMLMRRNTKRLVDVALHNPEYRKKNILRRVIKMSQGIKI